MPRRFHLPLPYAKQTFAFHALGFAHVGERIGGERNRDHDHFADLLGEISLVLLARVNNGGVQVRLLLVTPSNQLLFGLAQRSGAREVHQYRRARQPSGAPNAVADRLGPGGVVQQQDQLFFTPLHRRR